MTHEQTHASPPYLYPVHGRCHTRRPSSASKPRTQLNHECTRRTGPINPQTTHKPQHGHKRLGPPSDNPAVQNGSINTTTVQAPAQHSLEALKRENTRQRLRLSGRQQSAKARIPPSATGTFPQEGNPGTSPQEGNITAWARVDRAAYAATEGGVSSSYTSGRSVHLYILVVVDGRTAVFLVKQRGEGSQQT